MAKKSQVTAAVPAAIARIGAVGEREDVAGCVQTQRGDPAAAGEDRPASSEAGVQGAVDVETRQRVPCIGGAKNSTPAWPPEPKLVSRLPLALNLATANPKVPPAGKLGLPWLPTQMIFPSGWRGDARAALATDVAGGGQ